VPGGAPQFHPDAVPHIRRRAAWSIKKGVKNASGRAVGGLIEREIALVEYLMHD
jgi:hypothetical protein